MSELQIVGGSYERRLSSLSVSDGVPLLKDFFDRPTAMVAFDLLGMAVVVETKTAVVGGIVVETEAYFGKKDAACHASYGETPRSSIFYKSEPGTVYIFQCRGRYCVNVLTSGDFPAGCVLFRAIEPVWGIDLMRKRRQVDHDEDLTNGPAKLSEALGITKSLNGTMVNEGFLRMVNLDLDEYIGVASPRVGISKAAKYPFRYFVSGNRFVSKTRSKAY